MLSWFPFNHLGLLDQVFLVRTAAGFDALDAGEVGAVFSTDEAVLQKAREAAAFTESGVPASSAGFPPARPATPAPQETPAARPVSATHDSRAQLKEGGRCAHLLMTCGF